MAKTESIGPTNVRVTVVLKIQYRRLRKQQRIMMKILENRFILLGSLDAIKIKARRERPRIAWLLREKNADAATI
jgi:hypothetical protein